MPYKADLEWPLDDLDWIETNSGQRSGSASFVSEIQCHANSLQKWQPVFPTENLVKL